MKNLLIASIAALALTACGNAADSGSASKSVEATKSATTADVKTVTIAALVYADWCGSCKVLDPTIKKAKAMGPLPGVEFIVLDYTDKNDDNFYAQAEAAGVESAIRAYLDGTVKTGQLLLVDVDDAKVINKVTKVDAVPEILSKIKAAVSAS